MVTRPSSLRYALAFAPALLSLLSADVALAHGGLPRAFEILVEPGNPDDVLLRSNLWGFFRTQDGGKTFQWTCAEAYGSTSLAVNHQHFAIAPGGRLIVANAFQGVRYTDDGCEWTEAPGFSNMLASDVQVTADGVFVLTSTNTGTAAGMENVLFQSTDGGSHFAELSRALPGDFAASAFSRSPSDSKRFYAVGRSPGALDGTLERSDDGGLTFRAFPIPVSDDLPTLRIAALHPTRPDVLFVWVDYPEAYLQNAADSLLVTTDGGGTFQHVYDGTGDLPGFALSPDGSQVLVGGPLEGLVSATLDDALASGPSAFTGMFATPTRPEPSDRAVWGLHWDARGITGGVDNFTRKGVPAFFYGAWSDSDKTFSQIMSICDAPLAACGAGSTVGRACAPIYDDPSGGYLQDFLESPRCASRDAGTGTPSAVSDASTLDAGEQSAGHDGGTPEKAAPDGGTRSPAPVGAKKAAAAPSGSADSGCALSHVPAKPPPLLSLSLLLAPLLRRLKRSRVIAGAAARAAK